jgi:soluble lytic murein transglycosylase
LLQIIPPTALAIARSLKLDPPSADALYAPEINIRLGSWYLGQLLKRFGHPALAAAAYNAGPPAVSRWTKSKGTLPFDLFVEEIPYRETRGYVKQVIADHHVYHSLYGDPGKAPQLTLSVPQPAAEGVDF